MPWFHCRVCVWRTCCVSSKREEWIWKNQLFHILGIVEIYVIIKVKSNGYFCGRLWFVFRVCCFVICKPKWVETYIKVKNCIFRYFCLRFSPFQPLQKFIQVSQVGEKAESQKFELKWFILNWLKYVMASEMKSSLLFWQENCKGKKALFSFPLTKAPLHLHFPLKPPKFNQSKTTVPEVVLLCTDQSYEENQSVC